MKKRTFLIFVSYIWTKVLLGLVVSPFKSVREITRHHVLLPVVLSPFYGLLILFIAGRIFAWLFTFYGLKRELIAFVLSAGLISIFLWQILLFYLLINFLNV